MISRIYVFSAFIIVLFFLSTLREPPSSTTASENRPLASNATFIRLPVEPSTNAKLLPANPAATEELTATLDGNVRSVAFNKKKFDDVSLKLTVNATLTGDGTTTEDLVQVFVGGQMVKSVKTTSTDATVELNKNELTRFKNLGKKEVRVIRNRSGKTLSAVAGSIHIDTEGPRIQAIDLVGTPQTAKILVVSFKKSDAKFADPTTDKSKLGVSIKLLDNTLTPTSKEPGFSTPAFVGGVLRVTIPSLETGTYRFSTENIVDEFENPSEPGELVADFNSFPGPTPQPAVEFPDALPNKQTRDANANPGDFVDTRVARLYYFRDAHRVAQIINRRTKSYNAAAVTAGQRRYQQALGSYEKATDSRRQKERRAVQVSQQRQLVDRQLQEQLRFIEGLNRQLASLPNEKSPAVAETQGAAAAAATDGGTAAPSGSGTVPNSQAALVRKQIEDAQAEASRLNDELNQLRGAENQINLEVQSLQDEEDRTAQSEFRARVNSLSTDPNTYAPANTDSVDSAAQVSISVIGEGVLHLRGPINGINKIRLMINQIDTPLAQVKVGINTVQINGEDAQKMEKVAGLVEGHIGLGSHLTMQSLRMLRRAVVETAGQVAASADQGGHYQIDRDRKYLYMFFGRDFIDELYEMDSEFLRTENKLLSLHAMDTISLNRAMFIFALAKNDIRQQILMRFMELTQTELPIAEWKYRRQSELYPHRTRLVLPFKSRQKIECDMLEQVRLNAKQRYLFTNIQSFFASEMLGSDTMNPMQRTFIRLAQIFKSQLVAEMEVKQRVIERFVIEDQRDENFAQEAEEQKRIRQLAIAANRNATDKAVDLLEDYFSLATEVKSQISYLNYQEDVIAKISYDLAVETGSYFEEKKKRDETIKQSAFLESTAITEKARRKKDIRAFENLPDEYQKNLTTYYFNAAEKALTILDNVQKIVDRLKGLTIFEPSLGNQREKLVERYEEFITATNKQLDILKDVSRRTSGDGADTRTGLVLDYKVAVEKFEENFGMGLIRDSNWTQNFLAAHRRSVDELKSAAESYLRQSQITSSTTDLNEKVLDEIYAKIRGYRNLFTKCKNSEETRKRVGLFFYNFEALSKALSELHTSQNERKFWENTIVSNRSPLDQKKLLDHLIEEKTEKYVELLEGTRSHISVVDNYLKRLAIALEDDFKIQFYDPAFNRIRRAASKCAVNFGQVERTNVLMNNRSLAVVQPTATMEFNLPHRDIFIIEAMDNAKAMIQDYGALLKDPTFLAAFDMFGGAAAADKVQNLVPGLSSMNNEYSMGLTNSQNGGTGAALEGRVPDPAIYKFETGTGFEIKPVIQPDGDSLVYDFNYMYTSNIREPVNPNEKHLGRIKRHFIKTQVQTSSFSMREISRYQVALKASRTAKGVPGLEDVPVVGLLFKPAPSDDSSLQQNIVLGQSTIYPTLFDLMGLRWAKHVVDLDHLKLRDDDHIVRGRYNTINDVVFESASEFVDDFIDVRRRNDGKHYRPDLYHPQRERSPYHPNGYIYQDGAQRLTDPTGREFRVPDRRPPEFRQEPPYDPRFRRPVQYDDNIIPNSQNRGTLYNNSPTISPQNHVPPDSSGAQSSSMSYNRQQAEIVIPANNMLKKSHQQHAPVRNLPQPKISNRIEQLPVTDQRTIPNYRNELPTPSSQNKSNRRGFGN